VMICVTKVHEYGWSSKGLFFSYDVSNDDDEYINSKIQEMDDTFTLVLLTDFFDESLIMMKHLLCWSWDDVVYIKFKMRITEAKTEVNAMRCNICGVRFFIQLQIWKHLFLMAQALGKRQTW